MVSTYMDLLNSDDKDLGDLITKSCNPYVSWHLSFQFFSPTHGEKPEITNNIG
jgi:hypothetical protein